MPSQSFLQFMRSQFKTTGQTIADFAAEIKALSAEDKAWYHRAAIAEGYDVAAPVEVVKES